MSLDKMMSRLAAGYIVFSVAMVAGVNIIVCVMRSHRHEEPDSSDAQ